VSDRAQWGFYKICRKTGDFAHAIGAVLQDPVRGVLRAVIGATGSKPIVWTDAGVLIDAKSGGELDRQGAREALAAHGVRDPIRQQIYIAALRRAAAQAFAS